jgi:dTDP-4-amino-4,6-dideoxygalactose transaminase
MNRSTEFIPFARADIGSREQEAVLRVLRSGWLTTASETAALEREFAEIAGVRHALAVNSATSGLHLAVEAAGVGPGDLVAMSPYTFTSTAEVVRYLGADPLFVDIDPVTRTICPGALDAAVTAAVAAGSRVRAVIAVHIAGFPCNMDAILEIARRHHLTVVDDAAHCIPNRLGGRHLGTEGEIGVYSFYATKPIAAGEGGMVVTDNDEAAARMKTMRLHGIDRDVWNRYQSSTPSWRYDVVAAGYKYNLPDTAAAIARVQLSRAMELLEQRAELVRYYNQQLAGCRGLELPPTSDHHSHHLYILSVGSGESPERRDAMIEHLTEAGIGTSVHYRPLHLMSYYRDRYAFSPHHFPAAMNAYHRALSLPLHGSLSNADRERVIATVLEACDSRVEAG